ncbi:UNVERIFIED_CONTAM: hypothetical protein GTU68_026747 [Idotea baltica]|nr:hypothetical protein [Idotea baltica]
MQYTKSSELYAEAKKLFPGGVNSPVRAFRSVKGDPIFMERGEGAHIWDVDGNEYIDYCCSWGPLILGHKHPTVMDKIHDALDKGTTFGTPTAYGLELGKLIIDNNRFIEKIRFVSSGTEAVMSAVRLARGFTGRDKIIKFDGCYHGHVDHLLVKAGSGLATFGTSSSAGVPEAFAEKTIVLPLNDSEKLSEVLNEQGKEIACIIIEPVPANNGLLLQDKAFLSCLRQECDAHGILLIFDEVISGFRVGFEGAAGLYDIKPDIITYGKIIGGGMPVGAFGASEAIMSHVAPDGPVYQAGTLSANPVAMAAGYGQLSVCKEAGFYEKLEEKTANFVGAINKHCQANNYEVKLFNLSSIFWIAFTKTHKVQAASEIDGEKMSYFAELHQFMVQRNIYLAPSGYEVGFISAAHTKEDLDKTIQAFCDGFDFMFK